MRGWIVVALSFAFALGGAHAAERRHRRPPPETAELLLVPVQFCEKMCPQDFTPCDPINFKLADARCAQIGAGR